MNFATFRSDDVVRATRAWISQLNSDITRERSRMVDEELHRPWPFRARDTSEAIRRLKLNHRWDAAGLDRLDDNDRMQDLWQMAVRAGPGAVVLVCDRDVKTLGDYLAPLKLESFA